MTNLLTVILDDLANIWRLESRYGVAPITPNLDRLKASGTYFSNAVCTVPVCGPSRLNLFTGMTPAQSGATAFVPWTLLKARKQDMIFNHLRRAGYWVVSGGKVVDPRTAPDQFNVGTHDAYKGRGPTDTTGGVPIASSFSEILRLPEDNLTEDQGTLNWVLAQLAAAPTDRPLALFCGFFCPHTPYNVPSSFFDLYDPGQFTPPANFTAMDTANIPEYVRTFELSRGAAPGGAGDWRTDATAWRNAMWGNYAAISYADYLFGLLLDAWEASPFGADSAVNIISDHGYHLGDWWTWGKLTTLSPVCNLPMIWRGPGQVTARTVTKPVSLLDHFQTLCDYAEISVPRPVGKSLRPLIEGAADNSEHHAVSHVFGAVSALLESDAAGAYQHGGTVYRVAEYADRTVAIWNNETDYQNINNLVGQNPSRDAVLLNRLHAQAVQGGFGYADTPVGMRRRAAVAELRASANREAIRLTGGNEQVFTYNDLAEGSDLGEGYDMLWFLVDHQGTIHLPLGAEAATIAADNAYINGTPASVSRIGSIMANSLDNLLDNGRGSRGEIFGFAGNDTIIGGAMQYGGAGNDRLENHWLADQSYGGPGNDTLIGGGGTDLFDGGDGDDSIVGGGAKDTIYGGAGNDTIIANAGADWIDGGPGDDTIDAGPAADTVIASGGYDDIDLGVGANDTLIVKRIEATTTVRNFNTGDIFDLSDWSVLGPVTVTAQGADVLVRSGMETIVVKSASVNNVKAAITGATVAP